MRLSVRRLQPNAVFSSFLGLLDIKLGSEIILLFALINKVAGVYGLITIFVGGSFLQLSFYGYSIATLFAFQWALRAIKSEAAKPTLLVAHLYTIDHLILTVAHYLFFLHYWYATPHDGRRTANSQAQQDLIDLAASRGEIAQVEPGEGGEALAELRAALAGEIWAKEKHYAVWTLIFGWALKIYFILVLYSYAAHLRSSTYHALPLTSRSKATRVAHPTTQDDLRAEMEHDELEIGASNGDDEAGVLGGAGAGSAGSGSAGKQGKNGKPNGGNKGARGQDEDDEEFNWD